MMRLLRTILYLTLIALAPPAGARAQQPDGAIASAASPPTQAPAEITGDQLWGWSSYASEAWGRGGLHVVSGETPFVGRLVIRTADGAEQTCTATLVAAQYALTAGHCVCFEAPDFASCQASLNRVSTQFFLPAAGAFNNEGAPLVHRAYRRPNRATAGELADLALIRLDRAPQGVGWAQIAAQRFNSAHPHASISFGPLTLTRSVPYPDISEPLFQAGAEYAPGLAVTAVLPPDRLYLSSQPACQVPAGPQANAPRIRVEHAICARYSDIADEPGSGQQDYFACRGDSGGALIERTPDAKLRLVGVVSFFSRSLSDCSASERSGATYYMDLSAYADWIHSVVGEEAPAPGRLCFQVLRGSGAFVNAYVPADLRFVSVSVSTLAGADVPRFSLEAPGASCTTQAEYGFSACTVSGGPVTIRLPDPQTKAQIVFCYE